MLDQRTPKLIYKHHRYIVLCLSVNGKTAEPIEPNSKDSTLSKNFFLFVKIVVDKKIPDYMFFLCVYARRTYKHDFVKYKEYFLKRVKSLHLKTHRRKGKKIWSEFFYLDVFMRGAKKHYFDKKRKLFESWIFAFKNA